MQNNDSSQKEKMEYFCFAIENVSFNVRFNVNIKYEQKIIFAALLTYFQT